MSMRKRSGIEPGPWRSGYSIPPHVPYESFWSWVQKFSYQNQASFYDVRELLSAPAGGKRVGTRDLRASDAWDLNRLQILWQRPAGEGFVFDYLGATPRSVWRTMTSGRLCYCPVCMESGYHTPLFQVNGIGHCPIHELSLADRCPRCQQYMPYETTPVALWIPYGCSYCGRPLWQPMMGSADYRNADQTLIMDSVWHWLQEASSEQWGIGDALLARWQSERSGPNGHATGLVSYWYQVHQPPVSDMVVDCGRTAHVVQWGGERATHSYILDDGPTSRQDVLRTLYKAYARHWRREIHNHRSCIRAIVQHVTIVPTSANDWYATAVVCPWAYAYILWRMYWEALDEPGDVGRKRRTRWPRNTGPHAALGAGYWGTLATGDDHGQANARWLAEHAATVAFSSTRAECETLAQMMANANEMIWDPHLISEGPPAVFINEDSKIGVRFYWWPPPSRGQQALDDNLQAHRQDTHAQSLHIADTMRDRLITQAVRFPR